MGVCLLPFPAVIEKCQEEVEHVDEMPLQEVVDEGCEESENNQTRAGNEEEKVAFVPTGLDIKV